MAALLPARISRPAAALAPPIHDAGVEAAVQAWIEAPDATAQTAAMDRLQRLAWDTVPFASTGLFRLRTAFRRELEGMLQAPSPMLWDLRRA
ncbi:MAG: hypothetical protein NTW56_06845 [Alphaproteobacteria bacterium]|nr:hypothetical protein [Alphaproteobacteria bacterium]